MDDQEDRSSVKILIDLLAVPDIIAFLAQTAFIMSLTYLPVLAYNLGADGFLIGIIGGVHMITYIFATIIVGRLSDRIGQRKTIIYGAIFLIGLFAIYYFITNPVFFVPLKVMEGFGWAFIWPSLQAYVGGDAYKLKLYNISWSIGATVAPYVGGTVSQVFNVRDTFLITSSFMFLVIIQSLALKKGALKTSTKGQDTTSEQERDKVIFLFPLMFGFSIMLISTYFSIFAILNNVQVVQAGYMLTVSNTGKVLSFMLPYSILRKFGCKNALVFSTISIGILSSCIAILTSTILWYIILFIYGVFTGLIFSPVQYQILTASKERRGYYAGLFESSAGIGLFVAPILGGLVAGYNMNYVFFLPLALAFVLTAIVLLHSRHQVSIAFQNSPKQCS
ncbi:MAG: MFS transporter [Nitrososphaeria archaeon]